LVEKLVSAAFMWRSVSRAPAGCTQRRPSSRSRANVCRVPSASTSTTLLPSDCGIVVAAVPSSPRSSATATPWSGSLSRVGPEMLNDIPLPAGA
jgi:hypothetical protein